MPRKSACPRKASLLAWLTPIGLAFCVPTHAAGFDCAQAGTRVERQICGDQALSALDERLNEVYQALQDSATADQKRSLTREQRAWLSTRNQCSDATCLNDSYNARLNALDPLWDHQLTCAEMRAHPERLPSTREIDLGSGAGSPNLFDYDCPESLQQLAFLQHLQALAGVIRSEGSRCTGTIVFAHGRLHAYRLILAGFNPQGIPPGPTATRPGMSWRDFSTLDGDAGSPKTFLYFRQWSEQSPYTHQLYADFAAEYERVLPLLARHYQDHNGLSRASALIAAKSALMLLVDWAAGHAPQRLIEEDSELVQRVRDGGFQPQDVSGPGFSYSDAEIHDALRVALVNRAPLPVIEALGGKLDLSDRDRFAGEPLMSLATGDIGHLDYLLSRNVPVDATNGFGKTALFYAIGFSQRESVQRLLAAGADVNHAYKSEQQLHENNFSCNYPNLRHTRRTPLMHAAQNSDLPMVQLLLQAGADLTATDDLNFNALDYAAMGNNPDIEAFLKSLGLQYGAQAR